MSGCPRRHRSTSNLSYVVLERNKFNFAQGGFSTGVIQTVVELCDQAVDEFFDLFLLKRLIFCLGKVCQNPKPTDVEICWSTIPSALHLLVQKSPTGTLRVPRRSLTHSSTSAPGHQHRDLLRMSNASGPLGERF